MSELKWNWVYCPYLDAPGKQKESALKAGYIKVVSKSEADKVVAEKDKEIAKLKVDYREAYNTLQTTKMKLSLVLGSKSDVDAYIENMNKRHAEQIEKYQLSLDKSQAKIDCLLGNLLHNKYKRCLDKAERCEWERRFWTNSVLSGEGNLQWAKWAEKWRKRWLKLAERFKEEQ